MGNRWETQISRVGPQVSEEELASTDVGARWRKGVGEIRVACHHSNRVTALALHGDTLCVGDSSGVVSTSDLLSGARIGDYYVASNVPAAPITSLLYDGAAVIAGTASGQVFVWRAELPGSWGFKRGPEWTMRAGGDRNAKAHPGGDEVTGLATFTGSQLLASCAGREVAVWDRLGDSSEVLRLCSLELPSPVKALCADPVQGVMYAGTEDGSLHRLELKEKREKKAKKDQKDGVWALSAEEVAKFEAGRKAAIRALAWDAPSGSLLAGLANGDILQWSPGAEEQRFQRFHQKAVRSLSFGCLGTPLLISADDSGSLCVWDTVDRAPLWGLRGLDKSSLVVGDRGRLVASGVIVNKSRSGDLKMEMARLWTEDLPTKAEAPNCEAVLCVDLVPKTHRKETPGEEAVQPYWPTHDPRIQVLNEKAQLE